MPPTATTMQTAARTTSPRSCAPAGVSYWKSILVSFRSADSHAVRLKDGRGVGVLAVDVHAEVEVTAGGVAVVAHGSDHLAGLHLLSRPDADAVGEHVVIGGFRAVAVVEDDHVPGQAVMGVLVPGVGDQAAGGGVDRGAARGAEVDPGLEGAPARAVAARDGAVGGLDPLAIVVPPEPQR